MYTYYFLAALGPRFQKYLWWKRYLTTFQMVQFVLVMVKSSVLIFGFSECGYPWQFSVITASVMLLFLVLFANFYMQEYLVKKRAKAEKKRE